MSGEIGSRWNSLRPDEPARFASARRRGTGKRFVSFNAHLYGADGAQAVERDAVGVFTDSQLNALSLAAFLARCRLQRTSFVAWGAITRSRCKYIVSGRDRVSAPHGLTHPSGG
jgi:hypothetical protein